MGLRSRRRAERRERSLQGRTGPMASLKRGPVADIEILDVEEFGPEQQAGEDAAARRERQIGADVLELYCRFRAKDEPDMPQKIWIELLEKTIPKLKVRD